MSFLLQVATEREQSSNIQNVRGGDETSQSVLEAKVSTGLQNEAIASVSAHRHSATQSRGQQFRPGMKLRQLID